MAWIYLLLAAAAEIGWAVGLKYTEGFTRPLASVATVLLMIVSLVLLAMAVRTLPLGTAYAVWTGIGAVGTAAGGIVLFGESRDPARLACIALIVAGVLGLKLASGGRASPTESGGSAPPPPRSPAGSPEGRNR